MAKYKAINSEDPKLLGENVEIDSIDTNEPTKVVIGWKTVELKTLYIRAVTKSGKRLNLRKI